MGSSVYDVSTCRWSNKKEQVINSSQVRTFKATTPNGEEILAKGATAFADEYGLSARCIKHCLYGNTETHKGWTFKYDNTPLIYSEEDQLQEVIAKLKLGTDDRRLIVEGWHPSELDKQALPVCHKTMQFGIQGDKLNLSMYQRSCDVPLGIPFNIAGYSWLLSVIAHITGHKVGEFTHFMHDIHIYENQIENMKIQVERVPEQLPTLWINPDIKTLEDLETWVTPNDFKLVDYKHHEHINYPFTV